MPSLIVWPVVNATASAQAEAMKTQYRSVIRAEISSIIENKTRQALINEGYNTQDASEVASSVASSASDDVLNGVIGSIINRMMEFSIEIAKLFSKTSLDKTAELGQAITPLGPGKINI